MKEENETSLMSQAVAAWKQLKKWAEKYGLQKAVSSPNGSELVKQLRGNSEVRKAVLTTASRGGEDIDLASSVFWGNEPPEKRRFQEIVIRGAVEVFQKTGKGVVWPYTGPRAYQLAKSLTDEEQKLLSVGIYAPTRKLGTSLEDVIAEATRTSRDERTPSQIFFSWAMRYAPDAERRPANKSATGKAVREALTDELGEVGSLEEVGATATASETSETDELGDPVPAAEAVAATDELEDELGDPIPTAKPASATPAQPQSSNGVTQESLVAALRLQGTKGPNALADKVQSGSVAVPKAAELAKQMGWI